MGKRRNKVKGNLAYYHLMSRTVNGEAFFGNREKEVLRKMIWQVCGFSGVRVITYAVMKNHFHLFVEVPEQDRFVTDEEIVRRYRLLYPKPTPYQPMPAEILAHHLKENLHEGRQLREGLLRRMHDISWLMKTLKHRFSFWFNRSQDRFGPVWSERFKSVLVEGDKWALRTVAAYIDLNAVRAGLVEDPKDYRFCGYAEALGGSKLARNGLMVVDRDLAGYRQTLYGSGADPREGKGAISREEALKVLRTEKGKLPISVVLRCRLRYITDGVIIGSEDFVSSRLKEMGDLKKNPKPMKGAEWGGLSVAAGLHKDLFG